MRSIVFALYLVTITLLFGCDKSPSPGSLPTASSANTHAPQKITIAQFGHVFLYLPLYVAKAKGFFAEENLDVSLISTGGDDKTFAAVASGSAQFGVADPVFAAIAREQGKGGKVIASLVNSVPFWGVTYRKDVPQITDARQFANLKIATYPAPSTNYAVMAETLKSAGPAAGGAKIVQGAFGALLAMAKSKQADVVMELEPVASIAVSEGARVVYSAANGHREFAFTGITATDEHLQKHPEQAQGVVRAIAKALSWIRSDAEGALLVAKAEFPEVPEPVLRDALKRLLDENVIPLTPVLSEAAWKNAVQLRRELGDLKGDAAFADNVDMRFTVPQAVR